MKTFGSVQQSIWLIQTQADQPGCLYDQLPDGLTRVINRLSLEAALHFLNKQVKPRMIILEGRPDKIAQTVFSQLKSRAIELPIFLISEWANAGEIQNWLSKSIIEIVRPKFETELPPPNPYKLSQRETEILRLMVKGLIKKEIAEQLSISYHTVDNHERRIFKKMKIHTRSAAVAKALIEKIC